MQRDQFILRFLPLYLLGLEALPLFLSVRIFNLLPSGGRDGFDLTIPPHFLDLSCYYVELLFVIAVIHTGL